MYTGNTAHVDDFTFIIVSEFNYIPTYYVQSSIIEQRPMGRTYCTHHVLQYYIMRNRLLNLTNKYQNRPLDNNYYDIVR